MPKRPSSTTKPQTEFFYARRVHNGSLGVFEVCEVRCEVSEVKPHSKKKIFASGLG